MNTYLAAAYKNFDFFWPEEQMQRRFLGHHFEALPERIELLFNAGIQQKIRIQIDKFLVIKKN